MIKPYLQYYKFVILQVEKEKKGDAL